MSGLRVDSAGELGTPGQSPIRRTAGEGIFLPQKIPTPCSRVEWLDVLEVDARTTIWPESVA